MPLHAFVAMPFGKKRGINFDRVYEKLLKAALIEAGFEPFRADEEMRAGEIRTDMYQELLLADLVVVDISIDNPNVWYELGVRHGLRQSGIILIGCRNKRLPFDVAPDRTLRYSLKNGIPDPKTLAADKKKLVEFAVKTMAASRERKASPVYHLLSFLKESDWRTLAVAGSKEFWEAYKRWAGCVEIARQHNRPGDILTLAEEAPARVLSLEVRRAAGQALTKLGQYQLALQQYDLALQVEPTDRVCRQQKGVLLGRLARHAEARQQITDMLADHPNDSETWALLGRIRKEEWFSRWRLPGLKLDAMRKLAAQNLALLAEAILPYRKAFVQDPGHFFSGINALTLLHLYQHLGGNWSGANDQKKLECGVLWACQAAVERDPRDYWAQASLAEWHLAFSNEDQVRREYQAADALADGDLFKRDSSRQQLLLLHSLGFRPPILATALEVMKPGPIELKNAWQPRKVFLFSGHMIDKPDRPRPRFPADKEMVAAAAIEKLLQHLDAGPDDLAICGGACGGDILFAEAAAARGLRIHLYLQAEESEFLRESVSFAGNGWVNRFHRLKRMTNCRVSTQPQYLGPAPQGTSIYERNNHWQILTAVSLGAEKINFIALWDGRKEDGPGGTMHMIESIRRQGAAVYELKTTDLWKSKPGPKKPTPKNKK